MPTHLLSNLSIDEVSCVDFCANASTDPKTKRKTPHATIALWKRDSSADIDKHDPNPVQDPAGRFGLKDPAAATVDADEKTKAAQAVGSADNHKQAAIAHEHAMNLHLAEVGTANDPAKAQVHQTQAMAHDAAAKYHQAEGAKKGNGMNSTVVMQKIMKMLYPPLGNQTEQPKAQTFADVYAGIVQRLAAQGYETARLVRTVQPAPPAPSDTATR